MDRTVHTSRLRNVPTLRFPVLGDLSEQERAILERVAKRRGTTAEKLSEIWKAQAHWPPLLEANVREAVGGEKDVTQGTSGETDPNVRLFA
jgi:hypothetical protein